LCNVELPTRSREAGVIRNRNGHFQLSEVHGAQYIKIR
jgi:hypothetical protein